MSNHALPAPQKGWREAVAAWLRTPVAAIIFVAAGAGGVLTLVLIAANDAVFFKSSSLALIVVAGAAALALVVYVVVRFVLDPPVQALAPTRAGPEDALTRAERDMDALAVAPGGLAALTPEAVARVVSKYYDGRSGLSDVRDPVAKLLHLALTLAALSDAEQVQLDEGLEAFEAWLRQQFRDGNADRQAGARKAIFAIHLYRHTVQRYFDAKRAVP